MNLTGKWNDNNKDLVSLICILSSLICSNVVLTETKIFPSEGLSGSVKTNVLRKQPEPQQHWVLSPIVTKRNSENKKRLTKRCREVDVGKRQRVLRSVNV